VMKSPLLFTVAALLHHCSGFVAPGVSRIDGFRLRAGVISSPCRMSPLQWRPRTARRIQMMAGKETEVEYTLEKGEALPGGGSKYNIAVKVDASMAKGAFGGIMKDFKKVAQFPGFRKGTIPPFMLPKVKEFTILRCLEKTLTLVATQEKLKLAQSVKKPVLDDEQTLALVRAFKETQGFAYTIEAELMPNPDGDDPGLSDLLVREE